MKKKKNLTQEEVRALYNEQLQHERAENAREQEALNEKLNADRELESALIDDCVYRILKKIHSANFYVDNGNIIVWVWCGNHDPGKFYWRFKSALKERGYEYVDSSILLFWCRFKLKFHDPEKEKSEGWMPHEYNNLEKMIENLRENLK